MKEYTYKPFSDVLSVVPEEALPSMDGITFENDKRPTPYVGYAIAQKNLTEDTYKSGLAIDKGRAWDETEAKKIIDSSAVLGVMPCGLVNKEMTSGRTARSTCCRIICRSIPCSNRRTLCRCSILPMKQKSASR